MIQLKDQDLQEEQTVNITKRCVYLPSIIFVVLISVAIIYGLCASFCVDKSTCRASPINQTNSTVLLLRSNTTSINSTIATSCNNHNTSIIKGKPLNETDPPVRQKLSQIESPKKAPTFIGSDRKRRTICPESILEEVKRCLPESLLPLLPDTNQHPTQPCWAPFQDLSALEKCTHNALLGDLIRKKFPQTQQQNKKSEKIKRQIKSYSQEEDLDHVDDENEFTGEWTKHKRSDRWAYPRTGANRKFTKAKRRVRPSRNRSRQRQQLSVSRCIRIPMSRKRYAHNLESYEYDVPHYPRRVESNLKQLMKNILKEVIAEGDKPPEEPEYRDEEANDYYDDDYDYSAYPTHSGRPQLKIIKTPIRVHPTQTDVFQVDKTRELKSELRLIFKELVSEMAQKAANETASSKVNTPEKSNKNDIPKAPTDSVSKTN